MQERFRKKMKVWATWSSLVVSLWPLATRELTGEGQLFWRPAPIIFLSASFSFSSHPKAINLKQLLFKQQYVHLTYISPELIWGRWRWGRRWWQGRPRWRSTTCRTSRIDLPIRNCWFSLWAVVSQIYFLTKMSRERRSDCGVGGSKLWSQNRATACRAAKHIFETLSKGSCFYWRYLI